MKNPVDTVIHIETPEGVVLHLYTAGPFVRLLAFLIDLAVQSFCVVVVVLVLVFSRPFSIGAAGVSYIILFAIQWFYFILFEVLNRGRTLGKMVFGLQVIMMQGTPVTLNASVLRNFLRIADTLTQYISALISLCFTKGFRRLGDLAAGTIVVYTRNRSGSLHVKNKGTGLPALPVPSAQPLSVEEQKAVVSFSRRLHILGMERAKELSAIIAPHIDNRESAHTHPVTSVLSVASFIAGDAEYTEKPGT